MAQLTRQPNGNLDLQLTIPWTNIAQETEKLITEAVESAEIEGFRKGKAPRDMVEPRLDKTKLYTKSIERLLPDVYSAAITEHSLHPIVHPYIHLVSGEPDKDWEFTATTCELPVATFPADYETQLKQVKPEGDDKLNPLIAWLRDHSAVTIPDILIEEEANHRLSSLAENVTRLGLSMDSYLSSRKLTSETLRAQTSEQAKADLTVEFILESLRKTRDLKDRKATLDFLQSLV